jgi:hypothetical protein
MPRINVYVPDVMKERMDALGDRINWSEAAQLAFDREIANATPRGKDMEAVIERLRVSKADYQQSEKERGKKEGHDWACRHATYGDLRKVSGCRMDRSENFAQQIDEALGNNPGEGTSFWLNEKSGRIEYPSDEYAYAFWDAADDVFDEVDAKL